MNLSISVFLNVILIVICLAGNVEQNGKYVFIVLIGTIGGIINISITELITIRVAGTAT